jgi:hypothetical protein
VGAGQPLARQRRTYSSAPRPPWASPSAIPALKRRIGVLDSARASKIANAARTLATPDEVHALLAQAWQDVEAEASETHLS